MSNPNWIIWTEAEDLLLVSDLTTAELATRLGRSPAAVRQRRHSLGIKAQSWRAKICNVCGAPRWDQADKALCEMHFLDYQREKMRETNQRRKAGTLNSHLGRQALRQGEAVNP